MSEHRDRAKERRQNTSDAEGYVSQQLRNHRFVDFKFRRQVPLGIHIVDFVCFDRRLIVELDGGQHNEPAQKAYDVERDLWLTSQGFRVLRFWNHQVFIEWDVIEDAIWRELQRSR